MGKTELLATLIVNDSFSKCGACGKNADLDETTHTNTFGLDGPACGARYSAKSTQMRLTPQVQAVILAIRPDLPFVEMPLPEGFNPLDQAKLNLGDPYLKPVELLRTAFALPNGTMDVDRLIARLAVALDSEFRLRKTLGERCEELNAAKLRVAELEAELAIVTEAGRSRRH